MYKSQTALDIRQSVFGGKNIHVATAHEDLAYSSYVHQYSSGKFDNALWVHLLNSANYIPHELPCKCSPTPKVRLWYLGNVYAAAHIKCLTVHTGRRKDNWRCLLFV